MIENYMKWSNITPNDNNLWFWENLKKNSENVLDFRVGDGPSNRFFERAPTFTNFWRLDSDRPNQDLQFEPYDGHSVALAQKLSPNYEIFMTKS